jgi:hypothetical protein
VKKMLVIPMAIMVAGALISISCGGGGSDNPPSTSDLKVFTTELASWVEGNSGSTVVSATGGTKPYSWEFKSCAEPPPWVDCPMTGNSGPPNYDGIITGGPAPLLAPGTTRSYSPPFTVICTDAEGHQATKQFTIAIIRQHPTVTAVPGKMCVGEMYSDQSSQFPCVQIATASGGTPPYHFQSDTFREGPPPMGTNVGTQYAGLTQNGCLKGKIDKTGLYNFSVTVVDSVGQQDTTRTSVNVEECPKHTILVQSGFNCFIVPEGASTLYSGSGFGAIPVAEHSNICFRIISPPAFPENNLQCPEPIPETYCQVYVDGFPLGSVDEYCFTDVTEDHTIGTTSQ